MHKASYIEIGQETNYASSSELDLITEYCVFRKSCIQIM